MAVVPLIEAFLISTSFSFPIDEKMALGISFSGDDLGLVAVNAALNKYLKLHEEKSIHL